MFESLLIGWVIPGIQNSDPKKLKRFHVARSYRKTVYLGNRRNLGISQLDVIGFRLSLHGCKGLRCRSVKRQNPVSVKATKCEVKPLPKRGFPLAFRQQFDSVADLKDGDRRGVELRTMQRIQ